MEISAFPFLGQEKEDSHFYYSPLLFQDNFMDSSYNSSSLNPKTNVDDDSSSSLKRKKPTRTEFDNNDIKNGDKEGIMRDLLASLIMLDEEERQEQQLSFGSEQDKSSFNLIDSKRQESMDDYFVNMQTHFSKLDEMDRKRNKRARCSSTSAAAAAAAATAVAESGGVVQGQQQQRRMWVKDRSKDWWDRCNHPDFPEEEFKKAFRMSKSTFDMICSELDSAVMKKNTMLREAIPVRQRVAVCIWRLATGEPLRLVSKRFGLGISTCHKLVLEVCAAIRNILMPKFVLWPDEERMRMIKSEFHSLSHVPNVGGAMYTTHVPIIAPKIRVAEYFNKRHTERNQKTSYSITVQGVVDNKGAFTDICIGWPGSMSDDQVLQMSALYQQRASGGHLKDVWIVGNCGLPLMDWLLVPYTHQNLTWTQHAFNEKIEEVQKVAKNAFMRLKGRWSCLQKRTEIKLQDLPIVLGACCVLHNICEMRNEEMDAQLNFELFDDEVVPENSLRSVQAIQARDHIAHNLLHHGLTGTSFF